VGRFFGRHSVVVVCCSGSICCCCSSLDSHDVGSLSVMAWPADEESHFTPDAVNSLSQVSSL